MKKKSESILTTMKGILTKRILPVILAVALTATGIPGNLRSNEKKATEVQAATTLANPRIVSDSSMTAGQKVTWDCVWFGSYPQTEIVDKAETCGSYGKEWGKSTDYVINNSLYSRLKNATGWDSRGDLIFEGKKYRRIDLNDTIYENSYNESYYNWHYTNNYHYFRYDKIKWRVLKVSNGQAMLLTDQAIDTQKYHNEKVSVDWLGSTMRSWLNGLTALNNDLGIDFSDKSFIGCAFIDNEQKAIIPTNIDNKKTSPYSESHGGENTVDKIFLPSSYDVFETDESTSYGFLKEGGKNDEARLCKSSIYVKAMGVASAISIESSDEYIGNCSWLLRSPGFYHDYVARVNDFGNVNDWGVSTSGFCGVRPALNLNLSSTNLWSYAGTVCSDGTVDEVEAVNSGEEKDYYLPSVDGWGASNSSYANNISRIDDDVFWRVFDQSAWKNHLLKSNLEDVTGGVCQGLSAASALTYLEKPSVYSWVNGESNINKAINFGASDVFLRKNNLLLNTTFSKWIQALQLWQSTEEGVSMEKANKSYGLREIVERTKQFEATGDKPIIIGIRGLLGSIFQPPAGHAVLPYKVEEVKNETEEEKYRIYVYDCNRDPNQTNVDVDGAYLEVSFDSHGKGRWSYDMWDGSPSGTHTEWGTGQLFERISFYDNIEIMDDCFKSNYNLNTGTRNILFVYNSLINVEGNDADEIVPAKGYGNDTFYYVNPDNEITLSSETSEINLQYADNDSDIAIKSKAHCNLKINDSNSLFNVSATSLDDEGKIDICITTNEGGTQVFASTIPTKNEEFTLKEMKDGLEISGIDNIQLLSNGDNVETEKGLNINDKYIITKTKNGTFEIKEDVIIQKNNVVRASLITLSGLSHNIAAGKKIQLKAQVLPKGTKNKKLKWTSSNPKVATVNQNGLVVVKPKTGGKTAVITAKATDGSGKKATWSIKSMKGVVKKVTIKGKKKVKAGKALKLKAKVKATKGANKKLKWTSSNTKYAIVNGSGKVKTLKAGKGKKVKITAQATDGSGKKKSITIKITK